MDRGLILAADGRTVLAGSEPSEGELKYQRMYPQEPELGYGHLTGFYSFIFGRTELEHTQNDYLAARAEELLPQRFIDEVLGRDQEGANIVTTIDPDLQEVAARSLGSNEGAVAAIDPRTGDVLALVSNPTYDPNPVASHDPEEARRSYRQLDPDDPTSPLVSRATDTFFPPGSAFKMVTAAAALENGLGPDTLLPNPPAYDVPQTTDDLENFGGGQCSGGSQIDMAAAMTQSCNVYFAQLAVRDRRGGVRRPGACVRHVPGHPVRHPVRGGGDPQCQCVRRRHPRPGPVRHRAARRAAERPPHGADRREPSGTAGR